MNISHIQDIPKNNNPPFQLLTAGELTNLPPTKWRIRNVLPETGLGAIFGPSGSGKTFLALDIVQAISTGSDWFGFRANPCPVVYIALEGEGGISKRVRAITLRHGALADKVRFMVQQFDINSSKMVYELAETITNLKCNHGVVFIDTLNRAAPGCDENSSEDMGRIIASAKNLQELIGGLVILVHHTGKDSSKGMRGHSSLIAALDMAIEVIRNGDSREWKLFKAKDGEDGIAHPFRLEVVETGIDEDGEPITSCVVAEENFSQRAHMPKAPSGGHQKIVWDALAPLFIQAGVNRPIDAPQELPNGRPCLKLEYAIDKIKDKLTVPDKRKTERTKSAIDGLIARGLLDHINGFLWCK